MAQWFKDYSKVINPTKFMWEVKESSIAICICDVVVIGGSSRVTFKAELTESEKSTLDYLVSVHDATPLPEEEIVVSSILEVPDYAIPLVDKTYREQTWDVDTGVNSTVNPIVITWKYPIILLGGDLPIRADMVGDTAAFSMHPFYSTDDVCGQTTADTLVSNGYIEVSDIMAAYYLYKGFHVYLTDGATFNDDLGEIWRKTGNRIYVDQIPNNRDAGAYVVAYYDIIPTYKLNCHPHRVTIGENTQRGTFVDAGWTLKFNYLNYTQVDKNVAFSLEFYI